MCVAEFLRCKLNCANYLNGRKSSIDGAKNLYEMSEESNGFAQR